MPKFEKEYICEHSIEQVYQIVMDVEKYPEFLPWCKAVRITDEIENEMIVDMIISFKAFTEHYSSKVLLTPPVKGIASVHADLISGPFKYLRNHWKLKTIDNSQTSINFLIDFEFKSALLEKIIGVFFMQAVEKMIYAFEGRAIELYGKPTHGFRVTKKGRRRTKTAP